MKEQFHQWNRHMKVERDRERETKEYKVILQDRERDKGV